jgi:uncharacterized membrane protein YfcA
VQDCNVARFRPWFKLEKTMPALDFHQWMLAVFAALFVGLGKGGIPGAGNLAIVLMAMVFPSKVSVGVLLPVLVCADLVAVKIYHAHARWPILLKLLPWSLVGVGIGALIFQHVDNDLLTRFIGALLLFMVLLQPIRKRLAARSEDTSTPTTSSAFVRITGIIGGIATLVANAAGPIVALYLILAGLPKHAYIGTAAWFFLLLNLSKLPVQAAIGNLRPENLPISLILGMVAAAAAACAPILVKRISQQWFNALILAFVVIAALKMLLL